ncbi:MAG: xylan 1,4-beta-xylosidase, partial [Lachnospiraceae bacterium]|nr:xylan 1,4-beta-xylosidase [Lachnospiraceae bacterium]
MAEKEMIVITEESKAFFHNNVDFCIGTGRMGLALTQEYQDQLKLVQEEIGFQHIRGHGLFCDDMAIYQEYEEDGVKKAEST